MKDSLTDKLVTILMAPVLVMFVICGLCTATIGTVIELVLDKLTAHE